MVMRDQKYIWQKYTYENWRRSNSIISYMRNIFLRVHGLAFAFFVVGFKLFKILLVFIDYFILIVHYKQINAFARPTIKYFVLMNIIFDGIVTENCLIYFLMLPMTLRVSLYMTA